VPRKDNDFRITDIINPVTIYIGLFLWSLLCFLCS